MTPILIQPLRPRHIEAFPKAGDLPEQQFGKAVAFVKEDKVLGVGGAWNRDGFAYVGIILSEEARRYPVAMHKLALQALKGLHALGCEAIRARAETKRDARWLLRLGFSEIASGVFEHDGR